MQLTKKKKKKNELGNMFDLHQHASTSIEVSLVLLETNQDGMKPFVNELITLTIPKLGPFDISLKNSAAVLITELLKLVPPDQRPIRFKNDILGPFLSSHHGIDELSEFLITVEDVSENLYFSLPVHSKNKKKKKTTKKISDVLNCGT
jgi:hypothetical protein